MGCPGGINHQASHSVPWSTLVSTVTRAKGPDQSAEPDEAHSISVDLKGEVARPVSPVGTRIKMGDNPCI